MTEIKTSNAPSAIGPYSQAVDLGQMIYMSGQIPVNPKTGEMPQSIEEQTKQSLENVTSILAEAGLTMKNVVKTTVFLDDLEDFTVMNGIYETYFEKPYPARSCVEVAKIPKGAKVEIECIAVK